MRFSWDKRKKINQTEEGGKKRGKRNKIKEQGRLTFQRRRKKKLEEVAGINMRDFRHRGGGEKKEVPTKGISKRREGGVGIKATQDGEYRPVRERAVGEFCRHPSRPISPSAKRGSNAIHRNSRDFGGADKGKRWYLGKRVPKQEETRGKKGVRLVVVSDKK